MKNIGVDIGGTFIKCAVVDSEGKIIVSGKVPTPKEGALVPEAVKNVIFSILEKGGVDLSQINTIGVGTTGICDSKNGVVINGANIPGYKNIAICDYLTRETGKEAFLDNDANCAALGEYVVNEKRSDNFLFITLGTGVGGGIIINGKILRGVNGGAGEIGHITLIKDGEKCNCGRRGCWERYAAISALSRQTMDAGFTGNVNGKTAFEEAEKGNEKAKAVLEKWLEYVSEGVCNMVNIFQPDTVVIGGGVSYEGDKILIPIRNFVEKESMTGQMDNLKQTKILVSKLFNDAGVIGASFLYTQKN